MIEFVRLQLRHMLGGRRKWLVAACLLLPVLLTVAAVGAGGLGELQREMADEHVQQTWRNGEVPATAERVEWAGEDRRWFDGRLALGRDGLRFEGRTVDAGVLIFLNRGQLVVRGGELWIDPARGSSPDLTQVWRTQIRPEADAVESDIPSIDTIAAIYLFLLYPQVVCLLLALFYGTSVLGEELDGKTLTYLFTRPIARWRFVVGKYLGIVIGLSVPTAVSLLVSWMVMGGMGGPTLLLAVLCGTLGALLAYNALFVLFGFVIPRRAMIVALLYGAIFELILSFVPAIVNELTITYYLRSLVVGMLALEIPRELARMVGGASIPSALLVLTGIVVLALLAASLLASRREYVVKDTA